MIELVIKNQSEWDALPKRYDQFTVLKIAVDGKIVIKAVPDNSRAELWGSSSAELWESSSAELRESSSAVLWGSSSAVLWGSSSAVLRESSSAVLRESSSAELRESSRAVLWGSSSAVAHNTTTVYNYSVESTLVLFSYSVAFLFNKAKAKTKSKTTTIIQPKTKEGLTGWLDNEGVEGSNSVILYKRVSSDFKTQEGEANETLWTIGTTLTHSNWQPKGQECGEGKFHGCSRPYFCDEFRSKDGDRYIAIQVSKKDMHAWKNPQYPHKVAFRKGTVLHEVNRFGDKV